MTATMEKKPRKEREITNYDSIHKKLKRVRGKAKDYVCVDCKEAQAIHWSLNTGAMDLRFQQGGREDGRMFSTNIWSYSPRCMKCHSEHDRRNGLERAPSGVRNDRELELYCTVEGCGNPHHAKGKCNKHYIQERVANGLRK